MDLLMQLPKTTECYDAIVILTDGMSKTVKFASTETMVTAPQLADIFIVRIDDD